MKSYQISIGSIQRDLKLLKKHLEIIKKYPPNGIYLMDKEHLVMPRQYRLYDAIWRNKITFTIIASDLWEPTKDNIKYNMILGQLYAPNKTSLIPVEIKDLALYVHFKYKTSIFEKIIKTGKLPRR